jgi:hypothetical protein
LCHFIFPLYISLHSAYYSSPLYLLLYEVGRAYSTNRGEEECI